MRNNPYFSIANGSQSCAAPSETFNPTAGAWYHVVGVFDDSTDTVYFYRDGSQKASATATCSPGGIITSVHIGRGVSAELFDGTIDEVMVFTRALTANEIAFLYESSREKVTTYGEIPTIGEDENVTIVLAAPGSTYFDNVRVKAGEPKIRFVVPYQNVDIVNQSRFGPGDHNVVIRHYGTNTSSNRPMIGLEE
jgi:hypothetical protein